MCRSTSGGDPLHAFTASAVRLTALRLAAITYTSLS
jgi:hypothetical protein